jgi:hypothetical protein
MILYLNGVEGLSLLAGSVNAVVFVKSLMVKEVDSISLLQVVKIFAVFRILLMCNRSTGLVLCFSP